MQSSIIERYRVFDAEPLLSLDHTYEIKWQTRHLKKLRKQAKKPNLFHELYGFLHKTPEEKQRHYNEQVTEAIPFHTKMLNDHTKRQTFMSLYFKDGDLKSFRKLAPDRTYYPDYLIYDKINKQVFFANQKPSTTQQIWAIEVEKKGLAKVKDLSKDHLS